MRIKNGYITNSSSTGFIINFNNLGIPSAIELFLLINDNEIIKELVEISSIGYIVALLDKEELFPIDLSQPLIELEYRNCDIPYCISWSRELVMEEWKRTDNFKLNIQLIRKSKSIVHYEPEDKNYVYWSEPPDYFNYFDKKFFYKFWDIKIELVMN